MTILAILILVFCAGILCVVVWFMRNVLEKNHQYQQELMYATTDRVIVVVKETARAVSEAIAPPAPQHQPEYEQQPNADGQNEAASTEYVPWFLQSDGKWGTDPTDNMDDWLTAEGGDVNRVGSIRPGEDILPGPNVPTTLPGVARPDMSGENY